MAALQAEAQAKEDEDPTDEEAKEQARREAKLERERKELEKQNSAAAAQAQIAIHWVMLQDRGQRCGCGRSWHTIGKTRARSASTYVYKALVVGDKRISKRAAGLRDVLMDEQSRFPRALTVTFRHAMVTAGSLVILNPARGDTGEKSASYPLISHLAAPHGKVRTCGPLCW